jgi:hypothetical protein
MGFGAARAVAARRLKIDKPAGDLL